MRERAASVLREGVAPFRFLLCRQVTGDEMSIDVFELQLIVDLAVKIKLAEFGGVAMTVLSYAPPGKPQRRGGRLPTLPTEHLHRPEPRIGRTR